MGLDTVELILEVENTFGVKLPNAEVSKVATVGDLQNLVWEYVKHRSGRQCQSQKTFYRLRNLFNEHYSINKKKLVLSTNPNHIFPVKDRRNQYLYFKNTTALTLPSLTLPAAVQTVLFLLGLVLIAGSFALAFVLSKFYDYSKWLYVMPVLGILLTMFISKMMNPLRTVIEQNNLRDFMMKILTLNFSKIENQSQINRSDVDEVLRHIIADKAGLEPNEVTRDAKFADDLGLD